MLVSCVGACSPSGETVSREWLFGVARSPIFGEAGSWGLGQAAGGCAVLEDGVGGAQSGCTIGGCGERPLSSTMWPEHKWRGDEISPTAAKLLGGLAASEGGPARTPPRASRRRAKNGPRRMYKHTRTLT